MTADEFIEEMFKFSNIEVAEHSKRFFKTGRGEYGEGDVFIGVRVPQIRKICKAFKGMSLFEIQKLLDSKVHEHRLAAVIILSEQFATVTNNKRQIFEMYLRNVADYRINNWDIIDASAHKIVGPYLLNSDRKILYRLAKSPNLWERRVTMMATYYFIKNNEYEDTFKLTAELMNDRHDLIHKVCGWMLREVGKRSEGRAVLVSFLGDNAGKMPRTMLRYSIEKLSPKERQYYLKLK